MLSARLSLVALLGAASALVQAARADAQGGTDCAMTMIDPGNRQALYQAGTTLSTMVNPKKTKTDGNHFFDIPAPAPLGPAIGFFLCASGGEVTFPSEAFGRPSAGVRGSLPPRQALERLLSGTGLSIADETATGFILK